VPRNPLIAVNTAATALTNLEHQADKARARRDKAIGAAYNAGTSIAEIARAADLTAGRVSKILGYPSGRPGRPRTYVAASRAR
jgi:hypothetical protein